MENTVVFSSANNVLSARNTKVNKVTYSPISKIPVHVQTVDYQSAEVPSYQILLSNVQIDSHDEM